MSPSRRRAGLAMAGAALVVAGAGVSAARGDETWVAPAPARARTNPVADTEGARLAGRALFQKHCARCHGEKGDGDGPAAVDLRDEELQDRLTEGEIFWKISTGRKDGAEVVMPSLARKVKSETERWKVVLFVRSLRLAASPSPPPVQ